MKQVAYTIQSANADADRTSSAWNVNQIVSASFMLQTADATMAGTLKIQCSNQNPSPSGNSINNNFAPTVWADVPNATATVTAGAAPAIVIPNMCFQFVRVVFTRSAGAAANFKILANGLSV